MSTRSRTSILNGVLLASLMLANVSRAADITLTVDAVKQKSEALLKEGVTEAWKVTTKTKLYAEKMIFDLLIAKIELNEALGYGDVGPGSSLIIRAGELSVFAFASQVALGTINVLTPAEITWFAEYERMSKEISSLKKANVEVTEELLQKAGVSSKAELISLRNSQLVDHLASKPGVVRRAANLVRSGLSTATFAAIIVGATAISANAAIDVTQVLIDYLRETGADVNMSRAELKAALEKDRAILVKQIEAIDNN